MKLPEIDRVSTDMRFKEQREIRWRRKNQGQNYTCLFLKGKPGNYKTLNPSLAAIKSVTSQQCKQHFQTFWLEVEVLCCLPTSFRKHNGRKSRSPSPTPTKASFVLTNDHWSVNKNSKVELKIYNVEFEIWRGDWWNAASEYRMQNWHLSQM